MYVNSRRVFQCFSLGKQCALVLLFICFPLKIIRPRLVFQCFTLAIGTLRLCRGFERFALILRTRRVFLWFTLAILGTRFVFHDFALGIIRPTHVYRYFALRTYVTDLQRFALNRKYMCPSRFTMFTMSIKCRHRVFNCFAFGLKRLRRNFSVLQFT